MVRRRILPSDPFAGSNPKLMARNSSRRLTILASRSCFFRSSISVHVSFSPASIFANKATCFSLFFRSFSNSSRFFFSSFSLILLTRIAFRCSAAASRSFIPTNSPSLEETNEARRYLSLISSSYFCCSTRTSSSRCLLSYTRRLNFI